MREKGLAQHAASTFLDAPCTKSLFYVKTGVVGAGCRENIDMEERSEPCQARLWSPKEHFYGIRLAVRALFAYWFLVGNKGIRSLHSTLAIYSSVPTKNQ